MSERPIRHAVSVVIENDNGQTLFVLRSPNKSEFLLVWSLPSHFVNGDESLEETVMRVGRNKLGVTLDSIRLLNEGYGERHQFRLFMHVLAAKIAAGNPHLNSDDFVELKWSEPAVQLSSMRIMGDCWRLYGVYLENTLATMCLKAVS